jgi:hypothetical protein
LLELPDKAGYAEILTRAPGNSRSARPGRADSQVVVYFLQADGKSAQSPAPTDASLALDTPDGTKTVSLAPEAKVADPAQQGAFVSRPGPYGDGLIGELNATIGGKSVKVPFTIR